VAFNPYDYQRYFDALSSRQRSAVVSGSISLINHVADVGRGAEEAMRRQQEEQYYIDSQRGRHTTALSARQANAWQGGARGEGDCQRGSWRD